MKMVHLNCVTKMSRQCDERLRHKQALRKLEQNNASLLPIIDIFSQGDIDKEAWMAEMSKDAERRYQNRKVQREKADTLKTMGVKAFRRGEYEKALSCYNRAIEHVKDNSMLYCDRALTNIKLGKFEKVISKNLSYIISLKRVQTVLPAATEPCALCEI